MAGQKRGRPATGRSQARKHLGFEIARCYEELRAQGMSEEAAINDLKQREWQMFPGPLKALTLGEESIRAAIKESRKFGVFADDLDRSCRLKMHPFWGKLFERDIVTGEHRPVPANRLLTEAIKACREIRLIGPPSNKKF
ncbi:hypothetical protein F6V30_10740 [Oryzomonas sagensis]|uniref:Uncharacterized protein n=1 Tax=Oryzomonas sagensis TaxID=2603857 RepID=A0ABQ6TLM5_9BACT|nr:hypothetical protein [Oryzomonas sagensis]KAB0669292.1 hypothetical protein F6V30_10740 [Oryzomonas sagensis]